jgi:hypothetical protein
MRKTLFLAAVSLLAFPAAGQNPPAQTGQQQESTNPEIVVTGKSLAETGKALKDCLARHCPPDEDVAATIAHAENQFVKGDYKAARATLLAGAGRNRRYAKEYPVPVSDLFRANSRVAAHLGEGEAYRVGAMDVLGTLKAGLGNDDPRVLVARVEVADSLMKFGRVETAEQRYRDVVNEARKLHQPVIEAFAMLRIGSLHYELAMEDPSEWRGKAIKSLDELIDSPVPEHKPFGRAARVLKARLLAKMGDKSAIDAVLAELKSTPTSRPVLLFAEPIRQPDDPGRGGGQMSSTSRMATANVDDQWVDVSFWVAPDGHTTDVDILRSSPSYSGNWSKPIIDSIKTRRYAPLKLDASDPGILRVERYTFTARWALSTTGTHLRDRETDTRIEMLDLSTDDPAPAKVEVK